MLKRLTSSDRSARDIALIAGAVLAVPTVLVAQSIASPDAPLPAGPARPAIATPTAASEKKTDLAALITPTPLTVPRPAGRPTRVLVIGDEIANGYAASRRSAAFDRRVLGYLGQKHQATLVKPKIKKGTLRTRAVGALPSGADLTIVQFGTSDFALTKIAEFRTDYRRLIDRVYSASPNTKLVCVGIWQNPQTDRTPNGVAPAGYDDAIAKACRRGRFVSISGLFNTTGVRGPAGAKVFDGNASDTFHPNDNGHKAIARAIEAVLR